MICTTETCLLLMQCSFKSLCSVLCVLLRVTYFKDHLLAKFLIVLHKAYVVILINIYIYIYRKLFALWLSADVTKLSSVLLFTGRHPAPALLHLPLCCPHHRCLCLKVSAITVLSRGRNIEEACMLLTKVNQLINYQLVLYLRLHSSA